MLFFANHHSPFNWNEASAAGGMLSGKGGRDILVERAVLKTVKKQQIMLHGALSFTCLKLTRWDAVATFSYEDHFLLDDVNTFKKVLRS